MTREPDRVSLAIVWCVAMLSAGMVGLAYVGDTLLFLVLAAVTFLLLHSLWVFQLIKGHRWRSIDWTYFKIALAIFAVLGNIGVMLLNPKV